ncbi:YadA-like family protein [Rodentibacter caecimuris]|uniref:YadA-like family protein n=1 Tax=Rodentibacter caecimuris TaxID=1796644 RepID=UPI0009D282A6|nr:hypothetical protein BKG97_04555 [Rodentibacter heylii]
MAAVEGGTAPYGTIAISESGVLGGIQGGYESRTTRARVVGSGAVSDPASANRFDARGSIAIGGAAYIGNTIEAVALGRSAAVRSVDKAPAGSVSLGAYSVSGPLNTGNETKSITIGGNTYTYAGQPTTDKQNTSVLSIGSGSLFGQGGTSSGSSNWVYQYRQIQNVAAGRVASNSTDAINGSQLYAVVEALGNISAGTNGLTDFVVGADKNHNAAGINVTKDQKRFDIISGSESYLTTAVDGTSIKVDLSQNSKNAIDNVSKNTQNITKNAQNITNNAQNITKNAQNITKNTADIAKGFGLKAQDSKTVNKKLGEYVDVIGGNSNINTTVANGKIQINLNNSLDLGNNGNVKIGGTSLNGTGLTINNGPSVTTTGINASNKKVTNVSDGTIAANSKDAVNGSQLHATNQNVTNVSNNVTNLKNEVAKGWNITTSKSGTGNVANTTLSKVAMGENVTIDAGDNINITQAGKKVTIATSSTPNFSSVNTGSLTVRPNGNVNFGGNVLANIGAPVNDNDATTKKYVDEGRTTVTSNDGSVTINTTNGKNKNYDLSVNISNIPQNIKYKGDTGNGTNKLSEELHFKGSDLVTTKAENGTLSFDLSNNATFGLNTQSGNVSKKVGNTIDIEGNNSNINTLVDSGKVKINLNNNLNLTDSGSVTIGDTTLNSTGLTINGGPKVVKSGIDAGDKKVTNVSNGTIDANSKDAVNGSQLYATNLNVTNLSTEVAKGWNVNTSKSGTGNVSGNSLKNIKMGDTVTFDAGNNINITQNNSTISIATSLTPNFTSVDTGSLTVRGGGKVDFGGNTLTNVGNGTNGTDAVNLSQLNASAAASKTEVKAGNNVNVTETKGANNQTIYTVNADKSTVTNGSDKVKVTETVGANNVTNYSVDLSDDAKNQLKKEESVNSTNSNLIVTQNTTNDTGGKNYSVTLNNTLDLTNAGSVKLGDTTLNSTGLTIDGGPKVVKDGIDAGNKKITNVSEGEISNTSKDAVNGSQLYATNQNVTNLTTEVAKGWNLTTSKSGTGNVSNNTTEKVAMGETVIIEAGDNINITQAAKKVTIATSLTPNFTSVDTGNLTVRNGGKVDFGGNNITNVGAPVADNDATTKKYVDDGRTTVNSTDGSVTVNGTGTNPKNYDLSVNMTKVAEDVKFKYSGDNNSSGENKLSETVKFKGSDYVTTNASNGQIAFDLSDTAKNKINNAIQNFTVGADKNNQATGLNITNGGRFDIVGKDGNYIETNVSGKNITVALNQNATSAIEKAHKGFGLKAQDGSNVTKQLGEAIEIEGGNSNLNTTVADGKVKINLNNSLNLTDAGNVKIGDVNLTKDGLTINGGPNITKAGIDAGSKKITNVQDGDIAENSKDAVNGSQLYATNQNVTNISNEVAKGWNLTTSKSGTGNVSNNTTEKVAMGETVTIEAGDNINITQAAKKVTIATSLTPNFSSVDTGNLTVRNGGKVDFGGNNITNVGTPIADNDATTKKYVDDGRTTVTSTDGSVMVTPNGTQPKNYDLSVNMSKLTGDVSLKYKADTGNGTNKLSDEITFKGSDYINTTAKNGEIGFDLSKTAKDKIDNAIQNFTVGADQNNTATGINVTNGGRFDIVGSNYTTTAVNGSNITVGLDANATDAIDKARKGFGLKAQDGNNVTHQLGDVIEVVGGNSNLNTTIEDGKVKVNLNNTLNLTKDGSVTIGNTTVNDNGLTINGGPNVTIDGINAGNKKITNVADGEVAQDSKEAVNGGQLYTAIANSGFELATNGDATQAKDKRINNNETFNLNQSTNILVKQVDNGYEIATAENVSFTNVTVGKDGKDGTIGVNGKDGSSVVLNGKDGTIGINGKDGASANFTVANGSGTLDNATHGGNGINRLVYNTTNTDGSITTREIATKDDGLKFQGDSGDEIAKKLGSTLNITGGANKDALTDNNIGVISKDGNLTVKLAKDLNLTENGSVTIGNLTINKDGFNAGNTTITNVKGNLDNVTNTTTSNPNTTNYEDKKNNAATVGDVLNAGWNLQNNGQAVDFVTHGNTVNFNNGTGVSVNAVYDNATGTTNITFNTTNSYVDNNGALTNVPSNTVKFIGGNTSAPVLITNVDSGVLPNGAAIPAGKTFNDVLNNISGDALKNAVNVGDLQNATKDITNTALSGVKFNLATKSVNGTSGNATVADNLSDNDKQLTNNETFTLDAGNNIVIKQIANGYEIATSNNITVGQAGKDGKDGVDGSIGVNGKDGTSVVINGKDGSIGLTGPKGADGKNASANISVANGTGTLDTDDKGGKGIERLVYNTTNTDGTTTIREIATKDDGLKFKGDNGKEIAKKLGETLNIIGGVSEEDKLTDNNIGVINKDGNLTVKLAKDLNLTDNGSITIGDVNLTKEGLTIANGPSITNNGIDAGNHKVTNVSEGALSADSKDAVNGSQLYATNQNVTNISNEVAKGWNLTTAQSGTGKVSGNTTEKVAMGETVTIEAGDNINITQSGKKVTIATSNNITVGAAGKNGQDGVDGTIGVNGKDGSAVVINGKDGSIGLTGPKGADGKNGAGIALNGKDGTIGINGKDGASANFTVKEGSGTLDETGKGKEGITRLVYNTTNTDGTTTTREIATKDDGLKFKGDNGNEIAKKLGETLNIIGGVNDEAKLTDNNIGVINKDGNLTVKLAKDLNLTENGSVAIGNVTLNKDGFNAGNTTITNVKGNLDNVTNDTTSNPDSTGNKYANVTNNAATVGDVLNAGWNLQNNGQAVDFVTHGNTVNFKNGQGVKVGTSYNNATGTTDITFNTTNSYVDDNGNATAEPTNKVKFIGANASAPVAITNVDSGVLPNNATIPTGQTFNDVLNNLSGDALNNAVNAGDLKNATKDITNSTLSAVGFALTSKAVANTNGQSSVKDGLSEADKRLTNNETFTLDAGNNVRIKQIENGYEVATAENVTFTNITVGKDGKDGVDGTIGVNGKDGASVVINGKDGSIGLTGPKGKDGKDGASANLTVVNGTGTLDEAGKGKEGITRLVYNTTNTDGSTTTREIATKDDGLKFKGDNGEEIAKKLGETLNITGGLTDSNKLTDNNLGVVNQAGSLVIKLAKDLNLTKDGSLTIGNTTLNDNGFTLVGGPNVTTSGIDAGDKKITNVSDGDVSNNSKDAINGGQLYTAITNSGFNLTTKSVAGTNGQASADGLSDEDKRLANNETFTLDAGNNLVIKQIANGYEIATANNITVGAAGKDGKDGVDGSIGVNGKDGASVVINGKDGSIGLTGPKGADGKDGASANISVKDGAKGLDGNDGKNGESKTRIEYVKPNGDKETVATLNDGLKFKGDDGKEIAKKLNETLSITGGADKDKLTDGNIGVNNNNGTLEVKLSKDLNLTENGSVTIGNVTINKDGFNAGNTTITNVKGNLDNVTNDTKSNPDTAGNKYQNITNNAATVGDVLNAGWNLQNNGQAVDFVTHGNTVNFNNGTGVSVNAVYDNATGTTNITFNTTNSYVDSNGTLTSVPSNTVKFIGGNTSEPVLITNVDSGVLPNGTLILGNKTFNDVLNNITGDALKNAVNVSDLKYATKDITNTTLSAVGFALKSAKVADSNGVVETADDLSEEGKRLTNNETFNLNAGNNIVIKQINNGYEIATSNNITVGKDGKDGVDGKIGVNGKDGASVVLNGKDGSIGLTGPKGADGKDGASVNITVANGTGTLDDDDKGGKGIERLVYNTTNADGSTTTREIATKDDGLKFKGDNGKEIAKKLGETLNITGGVTDTTKLTNDNIGVTNENGNLSVKLSKDLNLTKDGSVTIGNTTLNDKGLTIAGGPSVTIDGINAGNKRITNVAEGVDPTDAVNLSQLNRSMAAAKTEVTAGKNVNVTSSTGANNQTIYTVNAEKSVVKGSDSVKVTANRDDANFTTTYDIDLSDEMKKQIAKEESVSAGDTNVKVVANGTNASGGKDFAVSLNKDLNLTKDGSVTIGGTTLKEGNLTMGNTTVGNDGLTIKDGPSITQNGIDAGNKVVNNVADGDISPNSKQAINGGQLHKAIANSGFNLATNGQDTAKDKRINNNETFNLNQGNNIVVKQIDNGYEISTGNNLVIGEKGEPGKDGQPGIDGKIGVNGKDGSSVVINGKDGSIGLTGPKGADGKDGASANISVKNGTKGLDGNDGKDGESKTRIVYAKPNGQTEEVATLNDGLKFKGDDGKEIAKKLNETLNITGGANGKLTDKNIGVVNEGGNLTVKLAENITLGDNGSVKIGNTTVNNNGLTIDGGPSVTTSGIDAGKKVISNVAPGVRPTDAVNKAQLDQVRGDVYNVNNRVDKLDKRVRGIGANAAAAASLPQVMLPGKSMVAAAAGGYSGASAVALGYSRASDNGKVILKLTGTANSAGHYSGGVGVGYQW